MVVITVKVCYVSSTSSFKAGRDSAEALDSITTYSCSCSCLVPVLAFVLVFSEVRRGTLIIRKRRQSNNEQSESVSIIGLFPQILIIALVIN